MSVSRVSAWLRASLPFGCVGSEMLGQLEEGPSFVMLEAEGGSPRCALAQQTDGGGSPAGETRPDSLPQEELRPPDRKDSGVASQGP